MTGGAPPVDTYSPPTSRRDTGGFDPRYGRKTLPPPREAGYMALVEWASEGEWPTPYDEDLATDLLLGIKPIHSAPEEQEIEPEPEPPGMRI